ncbi:helix-turn-helix transcriptional regulator [Paracoccus beibuensis]|uniref:helix-turn-helix transcriptional regulator n=1 Tax=Paracoccus beibuensis TaxID=547602 RepID=UPI002240E06D|nr:response regulator transcription factor [Paracoccus beibuensis]
MSICIRIASDSDLIRNFLHTALKKHFWDVESAADPDDYLNSEMFAGLLFWEISDPETCITKIESLAEEGLDLHHCLLILRHNDQFDALRSLVGKVGAILPPSVSALDLRHYAGAMKRDVCILPSAVVERLVQPRQAPMPAPLAFESLTKRERMILKHLSSGSCDKTIAAKLEISHSTVRIHIRSVLRKLGVQNRLQAALQASRM